jgi:hypothetical protein
LSFYLHLGLPNILIPSGAPSIIWHAVIFSPHCAVLIFLNKTTVTTHGLGYKLRHFLLCSILHLPFPFSGPLIKHVHYKSLQWMNSDRQINDVEAKLHLQPELSWFETALCSLPPNKLGASPFKYLHIHEYFNLTFH